MKFRRALPLLALLAGAAPALALEHLAVGAAPAVLYDAPSQKAQPLFVVAARSPLEVIVGLGQWVKVRDSSGDLAWAQRADLDGNRTLQVREGGARVHAKPSSTAAVVFETDADVLLDLVKAGPPGWAEVRHIDGQQGYVSVSQVWGL